MTTETPKLSTAIGKSARAKQAGLFEIEISRLEPRPKDIRFESRDVPGMHKKLMETGQLQPMSANKRNGKYRITNGITRALAMDEEYQKKFGKKAQVILYYNLTDDEEDFLDAAINSGQTELSQDEKLKFCEDHPQFDDESLREALGLKTIEHVRLYKQVAKEKQENRIKTKTGGRERGETNMYLMNELLKAPDEASKEFIAQKANQMDFTEHQGRTWIRNAVKLAKSAPEEYRKEILRDYVKFNDIRVDPTEWWRYPYVEKLVQRLKKSGVKRVLMLFANRPSRDSEPLDDTDFIIQGFGQENVVAVTLGSVAKMINEKYSKVETYAEDAVTLPFKKDLGKFDFVYQNNEDLSDVHPYRLIGMFEVFKSERIVMILPDILGKQLGNEQSDTHISRYYGFETPKHFMDFIKNYSKRSGLRTEILCESPKKDGVHVAMVEVSK